MTGIDVRTESESRALTGSKWSRDPDDVLPGWVADMDLVPPAVARDAVAEIALLGDFGYSRHHNEQLVEQFCAWQTSQHGWSPDPAELVIFNDVLHAIAQSIHLMTDPGDGIALLTPIYPPFLKALDGGFRRFVDVPLDPNGWRLDPDRLAAAIDDRTSAVLICNPHNPTGRVFDAEERAAIARVVVDNDLLLISDEVWGDLLHPGPAHGPMANLAADGDPELGREVAARTITISSASKSFNLAGLRCAIAHVGSKRLARRLAALPPHSLGAVGTTGAAAAVACWRDGHDWLSTTRSFLTDRRDQLAKRLADDLPEVGYQVPEATYLAWLDVSAYELGPDPSQWLIEHAKVALSPGNDFGPGGQGFVRLNTATSPELLDQIIDRIADAVAARR
ncbi:MAG: aminotransferase class I/II-fold pyridoxal phosphate-dependent enzyme [Actinomycetota bacterium]